VQLSVNPWDASRKRIQLFPSEGSCINANLAFRTWRIDLSADLETHEICLESIRTGYTEEALRQTEDPYCDKDVHRNYVLWTGKRTV
jgi:hypothetical protein